jgi:hypothetical protein
LTDHQLYKLVSETPVVVLPSAVQRVGQSQPDDLLYEKNVATDVCTMIVGTGKVTVIAGHDAFRSDASSWSLLGSGALEDGLYKPDFTAFVSSGPCRCIRMARQRFSASIDASVLERRSGGDYPVEPGEYTGHPPPQLEQEDTTPNPLHTTTSSLGSSNGVPEMTRSNKLIAALQVVEAASRNVSSIQMGSDDADPEQATAAATSSADLILDDKPLL